MSVPVVFLLRHSVSSLDVKGTFRMTEIRNVCLRPMYVSLYSVSCQSWVAANHTPAAQRESAGWQHRQNVTQQRFVRKSVFFKVYVCWMHQPLTCCMCACVCLCVCKCVSCFYLRYITWQKATHWSITAVSDTHTASSVHHISGVS